MKIEDAGRKACRAIDSSSHYGRIPTADGVAAVPPESISDAFSGTGRVGCHPDRKG
ncbi:hypothetical protein [Kiritimatiella glycovorans]|uniref:hypothetical protein n=1 Tax=Kiritimatiella glycovorans TaxID=1307763 RepID=UPI0013649DBD|nr:hypothetical protein [Kiritimatiella glycovorans]